MLKLMYLVSSKGVVDKRPSQINSRLCKTESETSTIGSDLFFLISIAVPSRTLMFLTVTTLEAGAEEVMLSVKMTGHLCKSFNKPVQTTGTCMLSSLIFGILSGHLNNSELLDDSIVLERSFTRSYLQTSAG